MIGILSAPPTRQAAARHLLAAAGRRIGPSAGASSSRLACHSPPSSAANLSTDAQSRPQPQPDPPKKERGLLGSAWEKYSPGRQRERIEMGERLFRAAQRRANDPTWYGPGRIGRDFRPRHAMLTMHVWFLHKRLVSDETDPQTSLLVQEELFDVFWNDTRSRIRAEGVNELTVNKHLSDTQQVTFQHLTHYDHAFEEYASDPDRRFEELAGAVWMHLLMKDEDSSDDHLKRLAAYVEYQFVNVCLELPEKYFREGRIDWGSLPDFSGMRDNDGKLLGDLPLNPEDCLPGGWLKTLTDAGDTYYWHPETGETRWEKPV